MIKKYWSTILLGAALFIASVLSLFVGVIDLDWNTLLSGGGGMELKILLLSRIPRLLAIMCTGVGMSVSGLIMQQLCMNKFVSPSTGATIQSAQFGILLSLVFVPAMGLWGRVMLAFAMSILGTWIFVWFVQKIQFKSTVLVPLIGIMFGNVLGGITSFIAYKFEVTQQLSTYFVGSFALIIKGNYELVWLAVPLVISAKVTIEYLTDYNPDDTNGAIMNLGTVKTADLEKVAACEPDIIFIGGRLSAVYADLEAIAPVVYLAVDYEKGIVESTKSNARTIAAIFGKEAEVDQMFTDFQPRIDALNAVLNGKNVLLGMYNSNALGLMGTASQLNMIANELGANNLSESVGEVEKATHGEEASWETIITLNPEYMFILDRSTATEAADQGVMGAREVIENDLIKELDVYQNGKIVYLIEHANVWYTSTGGVQALNTMLADLEGALLR